MTLPAQDIVERLRGVANLKLDEARVLHQPYCEEAADLIESLTADNEALRKALEAERAAMDVTQRRAMRANHRADALAQEVERLKAALTPSAGNKAAYIGEFFERIEVANPNFEDDDEPETLFLSVPVSWTTIKKIMAAISARAALGDRP